MVSMQPVREGTATTTPPRKGVYFGVDATNPTLILRIRSFLRAGIDLTAFTFRREKFNTAFRPDWQNIHLGTTVDRQYLRRLPILLTALGRIIRERATVREAEFIYCRNLDLLYLGLFAKWVARSPAVLVYEVEDVQEIFFKKTAMGWLFRRLEAFALRWVDLLVPLSPGFMHGYFEPVMGYIGASYVLENRIQPGEISGEATDRGRVWQGIRDRWVIGWFGTLRCPKSMALLEEIAERLGDKVEIYTRGYPTETGLDAYREIVDRHPNWHYDGPYTIPDDLEEMYGRVHFSWCLDFLDETGNSPLLLACRMYQGGYFGAVPLVVQGWEMDRWLTPRGIGHALAEPYADGVVALLDAMDWDRYEADRNRVMAVRDDFLEDGRDMAGLLASIAELSGPTPAPAATATPG